MMTKPDPYIADDHFCQRCRRPAVDLRMSWFNRQLICVFCVVLEKQHPMFQEAVNHVLDHLRAGEDDPEGMGLPDDLNKASKDYANRNVA